MKWMKASLLGCWLFPFNHDFWQSERKEGRGKERRGISGSERVTVVKINQAGTSSLRRAIQENI